MNSKSKPLQPLLTLRIVLAAFFSAIPLISFSAENIRISVSDFQVQSDNAQYKFLGKGFSELISVDISKSKGIDIVDREKKTEILREQELSQTGLIDEKDQIKVGRMLAARYIVTGSIFDIAGQLTVTFKVINTETGKMNFQDKITGKLSNYDYISAQISQKIINSFSLIVPKAVIAKAEAPIEKEAKAAVSFSNAIEAYDKRDMTLAKKELETTKELDPENEVVDIYLKKLSTTSPKFRVQLEKFAPSENPALLGILKQDKIYFIMSESTSHGIHMDKISDLYKIDERDGVNHIGYSFPVGNRMGLFMEYISAYSTAKVGQVNPGSQPPLDVLGDPNGDSINYQYNTYGIAFGGGYALSKNFGIGAALHIYYTKDNSHYFSSSSPGELSPGFKNKVNYSPDLGFYIKGFDDNLIFDMHYCMTTQDDYFLNEKKSKIIKGSYPGVIESTFTSAFFNKSLFLVLKGISDIYTDARNGYVFRGIPVAEYWPFFFISLRLGYEFTKLDLLERTANGGGLTAGATLRIWKFDLDFNYTRRYRPIRVNPGYAVHENYILVALTKNATFFER